MLRPRTAIPVHYEGWSHFTQGRTEVEREFAAAGAGVGECLRWIPLGAGVELAA